MDPPGIVADAFVGREEEPAAHVYLGKLSCNNNYFVSIEEPLGPSFEPEFDEIG